MTPSPRGSRGRELIVAVGSLALFAATTLLILGTARDTLGYDYSCYAGAARDLVDGRPIYDNTFSIHVGSCPGTFTYPPPFLALVVPLLALPSGAASWLWCLAMAAAFLGGVALLPVRRDVRWLVVIVGAVDWSLLYSIKLGQVGPILFLLFAVAWRWLDRPAAVGLAGAAGALVKVQPALLLVWAAATRRFRAAAIGVAAAVAIAAISVPFVGLDTWRSYIDLVLGLNGTLASAHNVAPGAVALHAGLPNGVATAAQYASVVLAAAAVLAAWRWASAEASLQVTVIVSQLVASPLRDHYAVLLLLPTAWLVERGYTWAIVFPLLGWASLPAVSDASNWPAALTVSLSFFGCLAAVLFVALRERRSGRIRGHHTAAGAARERLGSPIGGASA